MTVTAKATCRVSTHALSLNGKDTFLYSGEVHYFRIPRRYWAKHMQALVDAGCNAVSTYVPWSWHEPEEGRFDITGRTHPERDIVGYVELARKHGLFVTLKPGPYVMAETTDQGIPVWVARKYPDTLALDDQGRPWGEQFIAFASETLRQKSAKWLQYFARNVVVPRQNLKRGAVIMMQLCNEIGMFQWLGARGDYSPCTLAGWRDYLKKHYPDITELAKLLDREVHSYADITPPSNFCDTRRDFVLYRLWHDFHRWLYADYVKFLNGALRDAGVTVPLFTNVGGWVFGRAHEFALNGTFHRETAKVQPDVLYGLDHIPEFVSPLNVHDGIVANQTAAELQGRKGPLYSAELQCGSREHGVQTYPNELGLFYRLCIAHGLTAMNFYMFSQGRNPKGRGTDGPMFYWYNAVNYKAQRQPSYPMVQELGEWLKLNGDLLVQTKRPSSLAVGFYPHLYETEFLVPILGKGTKLNPGKLGLGIDPVEFRNRAYFDGVLRILTQKSVPYDLADLTRRSVQDLLRYQELVILTNEIMDAETQKKIVDFVRAGGKLVIFPMLPIYDRDFNPCRIMQKSFGYEVRHRGTSNRIYMEGLKDIPVPALPFVMKDHGGKILARDANGEVVGIEKKVGKGTVRFFGFHLNYSIEEHPDLWGAMMQLPQIHRNAWADNDLMHLEARFADGEGVLFVGNFHRMPVSAKIQVKNPRGGDAIDLGKVTVDGLRGLFLPVQTNLPNGATLVYALGELLERKARGNTVVFALRGPENAAGQCVVRTKKAVSAVTIDGEPAKFKTERNVTTIEYIQNGRKQIVEIK